MKQIEAAVLTEMGTPPPFAESAPLRFETLRLAGPGPGELQVEVRAACLCHSDLSVIDGSRPRPVPMVLGHEGSAVVVDVGEGTTGFEQGDHVVFSFVPACGRCAECLSGRPALCALAASANTAGTLLSGHRRLATISDQMVNHHLGVSCFAEEAVVSAQSVVKIDRSVDLARAALFGCGMLTGVGAVINTAQVPVGSSVAVFGLGGVGMAAVLGARLAGANPIIAVDPTLAKHALAQRSGATHCINADDETVENIREITGGGADFCFEAVGNARVLESAYAATGRGGTTVAIGLPHPDARLELPAVSIVAEERRLLGSYMGSAVPIRDIPRMIGLHVAGRLPLDDLISATLTPDEINEGFDRLRTGEVVRQIVLFD